MSHITISGPYGYTCVNCGTFVTYGTLHTCSRRGVELRPTDTPHYTYREDNQITRIIELLEQISRDIEVLKRHQG